ncbi:hypothetical protein IEO21_08712 [Rhodonia placenta]|uniref:Uncharacterized protein n=1 Tax=Rhodonia placenta TaxID=104341 RepID=A0A8H7NVT7_9APHY|nr:hypothetical protein IEO21_08712 [Postia placenta]
MSNLPSPSFQGPLTISASSVIDAPIDKVWQILVDFTSYSEWSNRHKQLIVDSSSKEPLPDQTPREGLYLLMEVHIPPTPDRSHTPTSRPLEMITAVDPAAHRVAWKNLMPSWFLRAERWQALSVVEDGKTLYETRERAAAGVPGGRRWTEAPSGAVLVIRVMCFLSLGVSSPSLALCWVDVDADTAVIDVIVMYTCYGLHERPCYLDTRPILIPHLARKCSHSEEITPLLHSDGSE